MEEAWNMTVVGYLMLIVTVKIKAIRVALLKWKHRTFKSQNKEIERARFRLSSILALPLPNDVLAKCQNLMQRIDKLIGQEECF